MAPTLEDANISKLIAKHLLKEPALLKAAEILGVHPAADATPEAIKAILPQRGVPWKQLLYGTSLQKKIAVSNLKTFYGFKALEMLERAQGLSTPPEQVSQARVDVSGSIDAAVTTITRATSKGHEKTHKQPRELLKTLASKIGHTPNLYTQATFLEGDLIQLENLSKNTAILAMQIVRDMQAQGTVKGDTMELVITNLSEYARKLGEQPEDIKKSLTALGGYAYGITFLDEETKELVITADLLFRVEFRYAQETLKSTTVKKYGTAFSSFILREPVQRVVIQLNKKLAASLAHRQKKTPLGLGGVLVTEAFITSQKTLSDMAAKILNFTASNHPRYSIAWEKLYRHLELTKQAKTQGRPRIQQRITLALQELKELGHLKSYEIEGTGIKLEYTDTLVKHTDHKRNNPTEVGPAGN